MQVHDIDSSGGVGVGACQSISLQLAACAHRTPRWCGEGNHCHCWTLTVVETPLNHPRKWPRRPNAGRCGDEPMSPLRRSARVRPAVGVAGAFKPGARPLRSFDAEQCIFWSFCKRWMKFFHGRQRRHPAHPLWCTNLVCRWFLFSNRFAVAADDLL